MYYKPNGDDIFNGVLYNNKGKYLITQSTDNAGVNRTENIVDNSASTHACTKNLPYSYFIFSFYGKNTIKVNKYSLRTYLFVGETATFPKSWVLSGFTGKKWINISTVVESKLNDNDKSDLFQADDTHAFSAIKITQISEAYGTKYNNLNYMCIADFELFGSFGICHPSCCNVQKDRRVISLLSIMFMLIIS